MSTSCKWILRALLPLDRLQVTSINQSRHWLESCLLILFEKCVRTAAAFNAKGLQLHVLINNAGVMRIGQPREVTVDGFEQHLAVNHFASMILPGGSSAFFFSMKF
jgi:NAD(P)-dependent dehydrogenase (short-subunit alcohol dehydrogenase family)